jgi:aldose 1-epimerase
MADQNQKAEIFELNNGTVQLLVTNLGCTITSFSVPGKDGSFLFSLIFQF